jgi:hypothetical protein
MTGFPFIFFHKKVSLYNRRSPFPLSLFPRVLLPRFPLLA